LPTIGDKLDFSRENLTWVVNSYTLSWTRRASAGARRRP